MRNNILESTVKLSEERMFFILCRSHLSQFLDIADCPGIHISIPETYGGAPIGLKDA